MATEEWRGRSGGYAIQGAGARLAVAVDGEVENVVGLPLRRSRGSARSCSVLQIHWPSWSPRTAVR